jgi:hypothetical protein
MDPGEAAIKAAELQRSFGGDGTALKMVDAVRDTVEAILVKKRKGLLPSTACYQGVDIM